MPNFIKHIDYINNLQKDIDTGELYKKYSQCCFITDYNVAKLIKFGKNHVYTIPTGEYSKDFKMVEKICNYLCEIQFPRNNSCIIAVGGGVVGDLAGFIASIYMRGVDFIQVPTTLLAMVDSSIGGKNGINNKYGKNIIGTIRQPKKIIIDINLLKTLPKEEIINGMAEIIKIAATSNKPLWNELNLHNLEEVMRNQDLLLDIIKAAVETKCIIVDNDEFEKKNANSNEKYIKYSRMILNFGHTFGHAIEKETGKKHGFCVAEGMLLETDNLYIKNKLQCCLSKYGLPIDITDNLNINNIISYMKCDKKGKNIIILDDIEKCKIIEYNEEFIKKKLCKKVMVHYNKVNTENEIISFIAPGSKSETNRLILLASLGCGETCLNGALICDDTLYMIEALQSFGVDIKFKGNINNGNNQDIIIKGCEGKFKGINDFEILPMEIFTGNSGTCMRFLTPIIATCFHNIEDDNIIIRGDKYMNKRPINGLVDVLKDCKIEYENQYGCPPIKINLLRKFCGGDIVFGPNGISSQFISGIMMAAPNAESDTNIIISKLYPSLSFVNLTYEMMLKFNIIIVRVEDDENVYYTIKADKYTNPPSIEIECDATACIYPMVHSMLSDVNLEISNIKETNKQGDFSLYKRMINVDTDMSETSINRVDLDSSDTSINRVDLDSSDTFMTFAVLYSFREGIYVLHNIANQNKKECKRIDATYEALKKCGVHIRLQNNEIFIRGKKNYPLNDKIIYLDCHDDHRLVMSFALLATKMNNIVLSNYKAVTKTYPLFWEDMKKLGLSFSPYMDDKLIEHKKTNIKYQNGTKIILIGMPNVGKTTLGEGLANNLNYEWIDIDNEILSIINNDNSYIISIPEYIRTNGWDRFRELEYKVLKDVLGSKSNIVISTGGGIIEYEASCELLLKEHFTVLLECNIHELPENSIYGISIEELWEKRKSSYIECSNYSYYIFDRKSDNNSIQIKKNKFYNWMIKILHKYEPRNGDLFLSIPHVDYICDDISNYEKYNTISCIEYRYDLYTNDIYKDSGIKDTLSRLFNFTNKDILFTDHSGEGFECLAQRLGCTLIDIDITRDKYAYELYPNTFLIASIHHNNINYIIENINRFLQHTKPDLIKVVYTISDNTNEGDYNCDDLDKFIKELKKKYKVLYIHNGIKGRITRITNEYLTPICFYESITNNEKTDKGQMTYKEVMDIRRTLYCNTDKMSKYYLYGSPIEHSLSPSIHNVLFKEKSMLCEYFKYETNNVEEVIEHFMKNNVKGASITIPLKEKFLDYPCSDDAKKIGAVNTLTLLEDGKIFGDNTDWMAIYNTIFENTCLDEYENIKALIIGTGGTARSACYAIQQLEFSLYIKGRSREKMNVFSENFNATPAYEINGQLKTNNEENLEKEISLIIITIPGSVSLDLTKYTNCKLIIDMAYDPIMKRKYNKNSEIIDGKEILYKQAELQNKIWEK